jgi:hypothetical protein
MFELLFLFGVFAFAVLCVIGILKLLVALVILPFKMAFWMAKGLLGLLLLLPLILIAYFVFVNALPLVLFVLLLPIVVVVAGFGLLLRLIF